MTRGWEKGSLTQAVGTEAANVITVSLTYLDPDGQAAAACLPWYIADDAAGLTPSTVAHSVGASASDGALIESVANLSGMVVFGSDGLAAIDLEEAGALSRYLVVVLQDGSLSVSAEVLHAA